MNALCKWFGHKITDHEPWRQYFYARKGVVDGIDRQHIEILCECKRCHKVVRFGYIHGDPSGKVV